MFLFGEIVFVLWGFIFLPISKSFILASFLWSPENFVATPCHNKMSSLSSPASFTANTLAQIVLKLAQIRMAGWLIKCCPSRDHPSGEMGS